MKEQTLSDKIVNLGIDRLEADWLKVRDVREFIQRLREELFDFDNPENKIDDVIVKLVGEELTGEES